MSPDNTVPEKNAPMAGPTTYCHYRQDTEGALHRQLQLEYGSNSDLGGRVLNKVRVNVISHDITR